MTNYDKFQIHWALYLANVKTRLFNFSQYSVMGLIINDPDANGRKVDTAKVLRQFNQFKKIQLAIPRRFAFNMVTLTGMDQVELNVPDMNYLYLGPETAKMRKPLGILSANSFLIPDERVFDHLLFKDKIFGSI